MSDIGSRIGDDVLVGRFFRDHEQYTEGYILERTAGGYYLVETLHRVSRFALMPAEQRLVNAEDVIQWRFFSDVDVFLSSPPNC